MKAFFKGINTWKQESLMKQVRHGSFHFLALVVGGVIWDLIFPFSLVLTYAVLGNRRLRKKTNWRNKRLNLKVIIRIH